MANIIIIGNLSEGFRFVGPFADFDDARRSLARCDDGNGNVVDRRDRDAASEAHRNRSPRAGAAALTWRNYEADRFAYIDAGKR